MCLRRWLRPPPPPPPPPPPCPAPYLSACTLLTLLVFLFNGTIAISWCVCMLYPCRAGVGLLITASQDRRFSDSYPYSTTTVILLSEWAKLLVAIFLYVSEFSLAALLNTHRDPKNLKVFALYAVPAFLYALVNNLAFVNLANYDPTTYFLLLQFRVVVTGVVYQVSDRLWFRPRRCACAHPRA